MTAESNEAYSTYERMIKQWSLDGTVHINIQIIKDVIIHDHLYKNGSINK